MTLSLRALWLASVWLLAAGCETLECGEGTHQEGDQCVPNDPINCASDHVEFRDGRCVPRASVCGEGTRFDLAQGICVSDGSAPANNAPNNNSDPADVPDDVPDADEDADAGDVPEVPPVPQCEDTAPGTVCLSGQAVDWSTGRPVVSAQPLALLLDDLLLRGARPDKMAFASTLLGPDAEFLLQSVPIQSEDGDLSQMILIVAPPPQLTPLWQRTLTGVPEAVRDQGLYPNATPFVVPLGLVQGWGEQLDLPEGEVLGETQGFLLVRAISADTRRPVTGARARFVDPAQDANYQKYYLTDDLRTFRQDGQTGDAGAVLIVGPAGVGSLTFDASGLTFSPQLGGVNAGLAVVSVVFGFTE